MVKKKTQVVVGETTSDVAVLSEETTDGSGGADRAGDDVSSVQDGGVTDVEPSGTSDPDVSGDVDGDGDVGTVPPAAPDDASALVDEPGQNHERAKLIAFR